MAVAPRTSIVALAVVFEAGIGVLALILGWALAIPLVDQLLITPKTVAWGMAATVPMVVVLAILASMQWSPCRKLLARVRDVAAPLFRDCSVWQLGIVALAAGMAEELLFRGVLQMEGTRIAGAATAIVLTSLVFGAMHALTPLYAIFAGFVSAYLGWLMVATDSLVPPIVAHAMYDWIALMYLVRYDRQTVEMAPTSTSGQGDT